MVRKVCFLFGAGAEASGNFDLPTGEAFLSDAIFDKESVKRKTVNLKEYFQNYRNDIFDIDKKIIKNIIISRLRTNKLSYQEFQDYINVFVSKYDLNEINVEKSKSEIGNNEQNIILEEFNRIITNKIRSHKNITCVFLKKLFEHDESENIKFNYDDFIGGSFEEYFHTIINPKKYGSVKFFKIFNLYWSCYFVIVGGVLKFLKKENPCLENFFKNDELNINQLVNNLSEITKLIYGIEIKDYRGTYYSLIKRKIDKKEIECCGVITTNYFNFGEIVSKNIAYINGSLKLFEFYEKLEVRDITKEKINDGDPFFPFILIPSLLKPIICPEQVIEYKKALDFLNESDCLVILGYGIKEEDNHLNALIHDFIYKETNKLIIVGGEKPEDVALRLKCDETQFKYVEYKGLTNEQVIDKVFFIYN